MQLSGLYEFFGAYSRRTVRDAGKPAILRLRTSGPESQVPEAKCFFAGKVSQVCKSGHFAFFTGCALKMSLHFDVSLLSPGQTLVSPLTHVLHRDKGCACLCLPVYPHAFVCALFSVFACPCARGTSASMTYCLSARLGSRHCLWLSKKQLERRFICDPLA